METLWLDPGEWLDCARSLHAEGWWLSDLAGVDRQGLPAMTLEPGADVRFEIAVQLLNRMATDRVTVHVAALGDPPTLPSVVGVWPGADFMEREAYDMFGILFDGHPSLTRILMPDDWEGHPLRKDYGVGKVRVEFKPQPFLQIESPGQAPDGVGARTPVDRLGQPAASGSDDR